MTEEQELKILRLYKSLCDAESSKPYDEYDPVAIQTVLMMLNILGLKISGINVNKEEGR